jgi:hypothetical protein
MGRELERWVPKNFYLRGPERGLHSQRSCSIDGNHLKITGESEGDCTLNLVLVETYLVATDNANNCGGMNLRLNSVYLREDN